MNISTLGEKAVMIIQPFQVGDVFDNTQTTAEYLSISFGTDNCYATTINTEILTGTAAVIKSYSVPLEKGDYDLWDGTNEAAFIFAAKKINAQIGKELIVFKIN